MESRPIVQAIHQNIGQVLIGKQDAIDLLLAALLCRGHVLIEDVPGVGKTTLAQAFARSLGLSFQRIQFTPDVLPSDITGFNLYDLKRGTMDFHRGAIMSQVILADEINRSSPKTQSSLLEVMQENQVTVEGVTYPVPQPFMVLATQNPIEYAGTFPLPEAQLDRFLMRIQLGYPDHVEEIQILQQHLRPPEISSLAVVADQAAIEALQDECDAVRVSDPVLEYIARIIERTRQHESIALGISPRGSIALMRAARAWACLQGRDFVLPDDVQRMLQPVLVHRLVLRPEAALDSESVPRLLNGILRGLVVPAVR
jgi:MoxR-like ATPase